MQRATKYITHKPRGSRLTADPPSIDNIGRRNKKAVAIRPAIADVLSLRPILSIDGGSTVSLDPLGL